MRYLSLCSGIEAATVAWKHLGWEPVGFAEIEPFPSAVLAHHYPHTKNYGDITRYKEWGIEPGTVDLVCGGPPCQAFSIAGARAGMADPRGNLTLTYLALVDHLKPRWIVYENVPGLLSSNGGADFARFIEGLALCGYHCAWRVYDPAQSFGSHRLPQRRRRVFLVGYLGAWEPPATVLFKPQGGGGNPAEGNPQGQDPASGPVASPGAHGCWWDGGQVSQCLDASVANRQTMPDKNRFPAVLEPIREKEATGCLTPFLPQRCRIHGVGGDAPTLSAEHGRGHGVPTILQPIPYRKSRRAQTKEDCETWVADGHANTLNVFDSGDTRTTHAMLEPLAFDAYNQTLTKDSQAVRSAACDIDHIGGVLELVNEPITFQPGNLMRHAVATPPAYAVRRLTVTECLRLQGFPDGYTAIPWRGKPADQCPDGPQYKAIGNSWAVTVARHIGEQIHLWESNQTK